MTSSPPWLPFGILADDLTGACDAGVRFSARGARVRVCLGPDATPEPGEGWDVLVLQSGSRHLKADDAARAARDGVRWLAGQGFPLGYKKIDSTLRGPLGAELRGVMEAGAEALLVCPAFPVAGRTVAGGALLVDGVPVHQTSFGADVRDPVRESNLPALLRADAGVEANLLTLAQVRGEEGPLPALAGGMLGNLPAVIVADAQEDRDLEALAGALTGAPGLGPGRAAGVGSAGLASGMAACLFPQAPPPTPPALPAGHTGVLAIVGSQHPVSREQVARLAAQDKTWHIEMDTAPLREAAASGEAPTPGGRAGHNTAGVFTAMARGNHALVQSLARGLMQGARVLLLSLPPPAPESSPEENARLAEYINRQLSLFALESLSLLRPAALFCCGGDISQAVLAGLEIGSLQLGSELLPGIPLSWSLDGEMPGLRIVTKAGGYGGPDALCEVADMLLAAE